MAKLTTLCFLLMIVYPNCILIMSEQIFPSNEGKLGRKLDESISPSYSTFNPSFSSPLGPSNEAQTWCIARPGEAQVSLQEGLDYACGIGGADCSMIQQGATCYLPNTVENHASYAYNSYFQNNPVPTSCNFGGTAMLVNTDPSTGSCTYPSSTTGSTATSGLLSPPSGFSTYNPAASTYNPAVSGPDSSPADSYTPSSSSLLQPFARFIILVASFTAKLILSS